MITSLQFPENELGSALDRILPYFKEHKFSLTAVYILILLYFSLPAFQIPYFEYYHFRITSLMEQRALESDMIYYPKQSWTSIDGVNPDLLKGIIAMEDGAFFSHKGIDWKELNMALRQNRRRNRVYRGASTLTMQLAKNLFFTTEKSLFRKAKELITTVRMEKELDKRTILQAYINAAEWGDAVFGIGAASEEYFQKDPDQLNTYECARLAAVLPSPLIHPPDRNSRYILRRASIIRGRLNDIILFPDEK
jgi:monofunctional biosynthetic peptidoglycan transglycosylase